MIHMHVASFILSLLTHGLSTKQDIKKKQGKGLKICKVFEL
jgi:hypothetical protein